MRTRSQNFRGLERETANTCMTWLSFDNVKGGYCETDEALESLLEKNALLDYAAQNWGDHAGEVRRSVMKSTLKILEDTTTSSSFQAMTVRRWACLIGNHDLRKYNSVRFTN